MDYSKPKKAVWSSGGVDIPVVIVGSYGELDGEEWLKLESGTGVKKSEVTFDKVGFWSRLFT